MVVRWRFRKSSDGVNGRRDEKKVRLFAFVVHESDPLR